MSIAKVNRITGSSTALPEIDGLMTRESIRADSANQTVFSITMFDDTKNIRAFVINEEVEVSWENGKAKLAAGVGVGEQVDFYGFGSRGITGTFWPSSDMGLVIENGIIVNVIQPEPQ